MQAPLFGYVRECECHTYIVLWTGEDSWRYLVIRRLIVRLQETQRRQIEYG
jgi:hypothetical protein